MFPDHQTAQNLNKSMIITKQLDYMREEGQSRGGSYYNKKEKYFKQVA